MKIEMARQADKSNKEYLFDLRMKILQEVDPIQSNGSALQLHHLAFNNQVMEKYIEEKQQ